MEETNELAHYGVLRKSGRYPWGSGKDPYQDAKDFKAYVADLRKNAGMTDAQIAKTISDWAGQPYSSSALHKDIAITTEKIRIENVNRAKYLRDHRQMSNSAIAELMLGSKSKESTVRGWLENFEAIKDKALTGIANMLRKELDRWDGFLDVSRGTNLYMGISKLKLDNAVALLVDEGYKTYNIKIPQMSGGGNMTEMKVLCKPGATWQDARQAMLESRIGNVASKTDDGGLTFKTPNLMPKFASSKDIEVRFAEDGGAAMDGVIELRRGVPELSLGNARYAQVRVAVDGTHFMKGMAIYADDLPPGVNIRYNSPKSKVDLKNDKLAAMKPLKIDKKTGEVDQRNPFGASTYPQMYVDKNGKEQQSALNIVGTLGRGNVEGRWYEWSRNLSSQMLSKQSLALAEAQLNKARQEKEEAFAKVMATTNPVVRQRLLEEFADSADADAVHLKAAKMPRQSTAVILPMNNVRPHEIYAPGYNNGEKVVLVRHPHGGPFEIPELTVNNNNPKAKRIMGGAPDAVGIHHSVAEQLSGADFDGDTVVVIPNDGPLKVKHRPPLEDLKGFDAKARYKIEDDDTTTPRMTKATTQTQMGNITNLITDMHVMGASDAEMARAVKHSMVVIDAEKHGLDYTRSAKEQGIKELKQTYQGSKGSRGASTIISRASSEDHVTRRRYLTGKGGIDPKTGEKVYVEKPGTYTNKAGKEVPLTTKGTKMEFVKDARSLMSDPKNPQPIETVYADYANSMKALANQARKESYALYGNLPKKSSAAAAVYNNELTSLDAKLKNALRNAPLERRAQMVANTLARSRIESDPSLDKEGIKKIKDQSLREAREVTGASKTKVYVEDREWEAIQAGALAPSKLKAILDQADMDRVKELSTPTYRSSISPGILSRAKAMRDQGKPLTEIADALGIPRTTLIDNLANG